VRQQPSLLRLVQHAEQHARLHSVAHRIFAQEGDTLAARGQRDERLHDVTVSGLAGSAIEGSVYGEQSLI